MKFNIKPSTELNFIAPESTISSIIEANMWLIIYLTEKIELGKPWGDFETNWYIQYQTNEHTEKVQAATEVPSTFNNKWLVCDCCKKNLAVDGPYCNSCIEILYEK